MLEQEVCAVRLARTDQRPLAGRSETVRSVVLSRVP
jgi:hypothetical protein